MNAPRPGAPAWPLRSAFSITPPFLWFMTCSVSVSEYLPIVEAQVPQSLDPGLAGTNPRFGASASADCYDVPKSRTWHLGNGLDGAVAVAKHPALLHYFSILAR